MKTKPIPPPENWRELNNHPLSELVEFGVGIDMEALAAHMQNHGYDEQETIVLLWVEERQRYEVLDGRHKLRGAILAEVEPTFSEFVGPDPHQFVLKKILRQHLDASQRAMIAAKLTDLKKGANQHTEGSSNDGPSTSRAQAASQMNVSTAAVDRAKLVQEHGTTELQKAVKDGTISVSDAARIAHDPPEVQNRAVQDVRGGRAKTASAATSVLNGQNSERNDSTSEPTRVGATNGKLKLFDWRSFDQDLAKIPRGLDAIKNAFEGEGDSAEYREARRLFGELQAVLALLKKRLNRMK